MPPEAVAAAGHVGRFDRAGASLSERITPLFVKELRQALRGRYLKITFSISIALTTLAAVIVLGIVVPLNFDEVREYSGLILFGATAGVTALVTTFLVPFAAFSSMNAEADENTLELLQLSNLSPLAIASGKLASAALQAMLVCAPSLPFAVVAWHMGGIPPSMLVLTPLVTVVSAACFSAIAIALSTLSRVRWVRIVLMVLFGFFLMNFGQYLLFVAAFGLAALFLPGSVRVFAGAVSIGAGVAVILGAFGFLAVALTFAADMLAHRGESGSTPMRKVTSVLALVGATVTVLGTIAGGGGAEATALTAFALATVFPALGWCCTEAEELPLGPRSRPPRAGWRGWLAIPHLAGGGRGALLATIVCATIGFGGAAGVVLAKGAWSEDATVVLYFAAYAWLCLLLPSVVFSPWGGRSAVRVLARLVVLLVFPWAALLAAAFVNVMLTGPGEHVFDTPANPVHMASLVDSTGDLDGPWQWGVFALFLALTFALNAWRMLQGVLEVRGAMRERHARDREGAAA